jgi:hypothetical protein
MADRLNQQQTVGWLSAIIILCNYRLHYIVHYWQSFIFNDALLSVKLTVATQRREWSTGQDGTGLDALFVPRSMDHVGQCLVSQSIHLMQSALLQ